jgi:acetyl-CoA carboxylase biotin carboxyl carrier protein
LNLKELKEILQILDEKEITEFELEEEGMKLRIRKAAAQSTLPVATAAAVAPVAPIAPAAAPTAPAPSSTAGATPGSVAPDEAGLVQVKSPIVGTFYRSPDPASPPFVSVGDRIQVGQVLCIIEAMKLMNEIEAEVAGEVVKVHHDSGQPVQYGEPLFAVRPER